MARATLGETARPDWSIAGHYEIVNAPQFSKQGKLAATSKKDRRITR